MEFFTLGVYNSGEEEFFGKLTANSIDTFCDIRQRRGVRGRTYAFVNSKKLQAKLFQKVVCLTLALPILLNAFLPAPCCGFLLHGGGTKTGNRREMFAAVIRLV